MNLYAFVMKNPIDHVDPLGEVTLLDTLITDTGETASRLAEIKRGKTLIGRIREVVDTISDVQEVGSAILDFADGMPDGMAFEVILGAIQEAAQGFRKNGSNSLNRLRQAVHRGYTGNAGFRLPSGKKVDFIDFAKGIVRELKPNNARAIKRGTKQIKDYIKELSQISEFKNIKWTGYLDTYKF